MKNFTLALIFTSLTLSAFADDCSIFANTKAWWRVGAVPTIIKGNEDGSIFGGAIPIDETFSGTCMNGSLTITGLAPGCTYSGKLENKQTKLIPHGGPITCSPINLVYLRPATES